MLLTAIIVAGAFMGQPTIPHDSDIQIIKHHVQETKQEVHVADIPAPVVAWSVDWDTLAQCESHGEWDYGPHSGWGSGIYHGGLQFHPGTWSSYRLDDYPEVAYLATPHQQKHVAELVLAAQGLRAWPACTRELGWR